MRPFYFVITLIVVSILVFLWRSQCTKTKDMEADNAGLRNLLLEKQVPIPYFWLRP